ncbi:MAG: multiubiquitin domain-containing protein [Bradyrhizobium sp.]|nr:multiubiquitin domain-containing protein [Bradyrhizobium sp.]
MNEGHPGGESHLIRVHINRERYEVESPTIGAKLYEIGNVGPHQELFREVDGNQDDVLVPREAEIQLVEDEHFYSQKDVEIVVNAEPKLVPGPRASFDQVLRLAFPNPLQGPNILTTITYRKGPAANEKGSLLPGQTVKIKNRMIFDVTQTDKS